MMYEKLSGFSDEITSDIEEQFKALTRFEIQYFEPRGINKKNISELTEAEMQDLKALMDRYGIKASSIGSPIGKIKVSDPFEPHLELLKNVIRAAKILDAPYVRIFSFYHESGTAWTAEEKAEVFQRIQRMIACAKEEGVTLLHENEKEIYGDTADRCLELMEAFYGPHFKAVFDPANFVQSGEDTKRAYGMLKPYIAYLHIKDARSADEQVVPAGYGDGNIEYILRDLFASGYDGFLSLEPHLRHFTGFDKLEIGGKVQDKAATGEEAFAIAKQALMAILDRGGIGKWRK